MTKSSKEAVVTMVWLRAAWGLYQPQQRGSPRRLPWPSPFELLSEGAKAQLDI